MASLPLYGFVTVSSAVEVGTVEIMTDEVCKACAIKDCILASTAFYRFPKMNQALFIYFEDTQGAKNGPIDVYLLEKGKCRCVLSTEGSGASFAEKTKKSYPIVGVYWHMSAFSGPITEYAWNGHRYRKIRTYERNTEKEME